MKRLSVFKVIFCVSIFFTQYIYVQGYYVSPWWIKYPAQLDYFDKTNKIHEMREATQKLIDVLFNMVMIKRESGTFQLNNAILDQLQNKAAFLSNDFLSKVELVVHQVFKGISLLELIRDGLDKIVEKKMDISPPQDIINTFTGFIDEAINAKNTLIGLIRQETSDLPMITESNIFINGLMPFVSHLESVELQLLDIRDDINRIPLSRLERWYHKKRSN